MNNQANISLNKTRSCDRSGFYYYKSFIVLICILFFCGKPGKAQDSNFDFALINVGVSSIIGGVGAIINKEPEEKFGQVLLKGVAQGALGGYVVFESKRMLREFSRTGNYAYVWPSKFVNSAGNSITENAASNQNFWVQWHINIGFNRFDIYTKDKFRLRYRIMPFSLFSTIEGFANYSFKASESLKFGTPVFGTEMIVIGEDDRISAAAKNNIILVEPITSHKSIAHELIHTYQYEQLSGFNNFLNKPSKFLERQSSLFKFYNTYFYTDWNSPIKNMLYNIKPKFEENIFEQEASYFER